MVKWEIHINQYKLEVIQCKNRHTKKKDRGKSLSGRA